MEIKTNDAYSKLKLEAIKLKDKLYGASVNHDKLLDEIDILKDKLSHRNMRIKDLSKYKDLAESYKEQLERAQRAFNHYKKENWVRY